MAKKKQEKATAAGSAAKRQAISKFFKELRQSRGLSAATLAEQAGINPLTIYRCEGGHVPTRQICEKLAQALKLSTLVASVEKISGQPLSDRKPNRAAGRKPGPKAKRAQYRPAAQVNDSGDAKSADLKFRTSQGVDVLVRLSGDSAEAVANAASDVLRLTTV